VAGGASLLWGLKRKGLFGGLLSLAGVELITYGVSGHHTHELLGVHPKDSNFDRRIPFQSGIRVEHAVSINAPIEQVYGYFRDFSNLPFFMKHVTDVEVLDTTRSRWNACGPLGTKVKWDAEIISDEPNKLISWRSINSPDIENAGSVHFEELPAGRGTAVRVELQYLPPAGAVGAVIAKLFGEEPEIQIKDDLRRFKQQIEAGEISTTKGQPQGETSARQRSRGEGESDFERNFQAREPRPHGDRGNEQSDGQQRGQQQEPEKARGASAD
jgi:uncharacterized membrane protein